MLRPYKHCSAFTLLELLVSAAITVVLVAFAARLFYAASTTTKTTYVHMDADAQARALFSRVGIDFAQMARRADMDYYLKSSALPQAGDDQLSFYSEVPGYGATSQGSVSLVAYRMNAQHELERMGKGLPWNGSTSSESPVVFLPLTIAATWPTAANSGADPDYESVGPRVFRFEYYYVLTNGTLADSPWTGATGHTTYNGLQDVASICVCIATIDDKARGLISPAQSTTLAGQLSDFDVTMGPGELPNRWQVAVDSSTTLPRAVSSSVRVFQRVFSLPPKQ